MSANIDAEIAAVEKELHGMSYGAVMYPILTQKLVALRLAKQQAIPDHAAKPPGNQPNTVKDWYDKPVGKIGLGVFIGVIILCAAFVFRHYFGFPF